MSAVDDHPVVLSGGLVGSPIGGALLSYLTRVETACYGSSNPITGDRGGPCVYDYDPAAGAVATVLGWIITGTAMAVLKSK